MQVRRTVDVWLLSDAPRAWSDNGTMVSNQPILLEEVQSIIHDHMSITTTNAKRVDRHSAEASLRPWRCFGGEFQMPRILYLGVGPVEPDIWWNDASLKREDSFDDCSNSSRTFKMTHVAFEGTHIKGFVWRPVRRKDLGDSTGFDWIAHLSARAVCLEEPGHRGVESSSFVDMLDKSSLASLGWLCDTRRLAILVRGGISDDGANNVAITDCIRDALQYQGAESLPTSIPVSSVVKTVRFAVRTENASSVQFQSHLGREHEIATANNGLQRSAHST